MATTNVATKNTNTAAEAAPAKPESKMSRAKKLYDEIYGRGYVLKANSQRAEFIERAMNEIGLSKAGANTYFQNLANEARGQDRYKYNRYESKKPATEAKDEAQGDDLPGSTTKAAVKKMEDEATKTAVNMSLRWQCINDRGEVVNSFPSRKAAREFCDADGELTVKDSKAS